MSEQRTLADEARISRAEGLVASDVNGEAVILCIESGHFFHLNGIGSRIWDILEAPMTLAAICAAMRETFEVDADECRRDVAEFVQQIRDKGLVVSL